MPDKPMTPEDASRIQSSQAKNGRDMASGSFAARAQAAAARNVNSGAVAGQGGRGGHGSSGGQMAKK